MKRETPIGTFDGLEVVLEQRTRRTLESPVPDTFAVFRREGVEVGRRNLDKLAPRLARLLPPAYAHAPIAAWRPLLVMIAP